MRFGEADEAIFKNRLRFIKKIKTEDNYITKNRTCQIHISSFAGDRPYRTERKM